LTEITEDGVARPKATPTSSWGSAGWSCPPPLALVMGDFNNSVMLIINTSINSWRYIIWTMSQELE